MRTRETNGLGPRRRRPRAASFLAIGMVLVACGTGSSRSDQPLPSLSLRNWDVDAGLPSPRVYALAHTPDGSVWVGSYAGLCRFDGRSFTTFTPRESPALGDPVVRALSVDERGRLWGGTDRGHLFTHDESGFDAIAVPEAAGMAIAAIRFHPDGTVWLATRGGVLAVRGEVTKVFGRAEGLASSDVRDLVLDGGTLWALAGGKLHHFSGEAWVEVAIAEAPRHDITAIAASAAGGVWCAERAAVLPEGRASRVFRVNATATDVPPEAGPWPISPERSRIDALCEDPQGRLWCASRGGGVHCRERGGRWWTAGRGTSLARADGTSFAIDRAGSVWIGTRANGMYQAAQAVVHPRPLPAGMDDYVVTTVAATADGRLWAGTDGGGVVRWQGDDHRTFDQDDGLASLRITALASGRDGLYAATLGGLARFDGSRFVTVPVQDRTEPIACHCLLAEGDDTVWVGTRESTVRVTAGRPVEVRRADAARLSTVCFARADDGRLLALSRDGALYEHVDGVFEEVAVEASDPFTGSRVITVDHQGGVWLGSYGSGLARVADGRLQRWSQQANGLPSSHVVALVPTEGVVWVGSENGFYGCPIDAFAGSEPGQAMAVWRITQAEGLPERVCTAGGQPAACLGPDGMVWMANGRSVAGFRPADAMRPVEVFPPWVERLIADGVEVSLPPGNAPSIPAGVARLEFRITSPNTAAPGRLAFRHRLAGFDSEWVDLEDRRVISYTGLPPGDYGLQVEVRGPNGDWVGMTRDIAVRIPPRFWQRRGVQAAGFGGLIGVVAALVWAGERRRSQRRLERLRIDQAREQERQRIARDIHDDIGSGLTEIVMLSHLAARDGDAATTIQRIEDRARRLTRAMDEVVWAINPRNDSLEGFITYFHRWAQAFLGNAGVRVRWDLPLEPTETPLAAEVRHQLLLACKEAVTNVVKHAGAREVRIACHPRAAGLEIRIEDDGQGFLEAGGESGRHGLENLRERLAALGGTCGIESAPGLGTRVRFEVATDRQAAVVGDTGAGSS